MEITQGKLLRGKSFIVKGVGTLEPITVDEIIDIDEQKYYKYLNNLCFDIDDLQTSKEEKQELIDKNITSYQIIISGCLNDINYLQLIIKAFKFFFKEDVCFLKQLGIFFLGNFNEHRFITSDNFEEIKIILRLQNCMSKNDILDENPKDEHARILLEKRRKARQKLAKAKNSENDNEDNIPLTFSDLISIMCANANGINYENVWNMNIYLFQDQFQRMKLIEDYDIGIRSLLAGANPNEVDLKYYMSHL